MSKRYSRCRRFTETRNSKVMRRVIKAAYLGKELGDLSSLVNPEVVPFIQGLQSSKL